MDTYMDGERLDWSFPHFHFLLRTKLKIIVRIILMRIEEAIGK
ncbi:MAG TPA: hypothetical protein VNN20_03540 [Thermodesulfobacteriota bacterium]|nr:hypothetical protein [Thermodesulfobacteriota bacterium]